MTLHVETICCVSNFVAQGEVILVLPVPKRWENLLMLEVSTTGKVRLRKRDQALSTTSNVFCSMEGLRVTCGSASLCLQPINDPSHKTCEIHWKYIWQSNKFLYGNRSWYCPRAARLLLSAILYTKWLSVISLTVK